MLEVLPDLESLSRAGAELFVARANDACTKRGRFCVALSGGNTPRMLYEALAKPPLRDQVPWANVHVFWGDERCVPHADPKSNYGAARTALLDHVPIPSSQVHPVPYSVSPEQSAGAYDSELRQFFGTRPAFDLVLLGMGADGHTASLFPAAAALHEHKRWATWTPGADVARVTLTADVINQAETVVFLIAGADKAEVLRRVVGATRSRSTGLASETVEHNSPQSLPLGGALLPAQLIRPASGDVRWLVDKPAASRLDR
jgi:6-phosphogluconolactonase